MSHGILCRCSRCRKQSQIRVRGVKPKARLWVGGIEDFHESALSQARQTSNYLKIQNRDIRNYRKRPRGKTPHEFMGASLPIVHARIGPVLQDGRFYSSKDARPAHPLPLNRDREKFVWYSKDEYEFDILVLEKARTNLKRMLLEGLDGLKYKRADDELLAQLARCESRRKSCIAIAIKSKELGVKEKQFKALRGGRWYNLDSESQFEAMKVANFKVRVIEAGRKKIWQVNPTVTRRELIKHA